MKFPTRYSPKNRSGYQWLQEIPQGFHPGVDFNYGSGSDDEGQDVVAITDGIVKHAKFCGGWGNHVVIFHPKYNVWSHYAHLKSLNVENGEEVKEGQLVGPLGGTGSSSSPHLHFEIRLTDMSFDKYVTGMSREEVATNYTDSEKWINDKIVEETKQMQPQNLQEITNNLSMKLIRNSVTNKIYCIGVDNKKHWIFNPETFEVGKAMGFWNINMDQVPIQDDDSYELGHTLLLIKQ